MKLLMILSIGQRGLSRLTALRGSSRISVMILALFLLIKNAMCCWHGWI